VNPVASLALRPTWVACALLASCAALGLLGLSVGASGWDGWAGLLAAGHDPLRAQIVWDIRLPRTLGALVAGGLLGVAGALAQSVFRNPLADPYLLGSAAGAGLGVALVLAIWSGAAGLLGLSGGAAAPTPVWVARLGLTGAAFLGSLGAVVLTLSLAQGAGNSLRLLLSGVVVGVILAALTQLVLVASPESMLNMQSFMLGTTAFMSWPSVGIMAAVALPALVVAAVLGRAMDALSLGDETARSLGLSVGHVRLGAVAMLALCTASAVAQAGLIAFVGLAAPHLVRALVRAGATWLCVLSALAGGALLAAADVVARGVIPPQELPVGVVTALLGGGYLLLLLRKRGAWL
jgi:iron complex transport system permease protein